MSTDDLASPATQADVALRVGCTQRSVSVAFGGSGRISAELRARILSIADDLGYRPHAGARDLRLGRSRPVALLQSAEPIASWLPQALLMGLEEGLAAHGRHLAVIRLADADLLADGALPRTLESLGADSLLLNYDAAIPPGLPRLLERYRIPAVWVNSRQDAACVRPDDYQAGSLLAEHLASLGHRCAIWADFTGWFGAVQHYSHRDRWEGFRDQGSRLGLTSVLMAPSASLPGDGHCCDLVDLLRATRATAVATYSPLEAGAAVVAIERIGGSLPVTHSLATAHIDWVAISRPLTVARNPMHAVGLAAATALITGDQRVQVCPYWLEIGSSTGPAPIQ